MYGHLGHDAVPHHQRVEYPRNRFVAASIRRIKTPQFPGVDVLLRRKNRVGCRLCNPSTSERARYVTPCVFFPLHCSDASYNSANRRRPQAMPLRGKTILAVDDNAAHNHAHVRILEKTHATVLTAFIGREALRLAKLKPDLIILDVVLPDTSGFDLCRQLKADPRTARIPVVFLSAEVQDDDSVQQGKGSGGSAYLFDPVEPSHLLRVVEAHIAGRAASLRR